MPLYHMTPHENLESILKTGLLPAHGNFVCLCEDPLSWYRDYARLAVDIDAFRRDNPGVRVTTWLPDLDEVCVWGTIPPEYIRLCDGDIEGGEANHVVRCSCFHSGVDPVRQSERVDLISGLAAVRPSPQQKGGQMNDTHGVKGKGWYGFDLDGTLAKYNGWKGIDHIGEPVKPMVDLIRRMHDEGKVVKIMTARIAPHKLEDGTVGEAYITVPNGEKGATKNYAHQFINDWCHFNLGFLPEIVYQKDHLMLELYDDRVKQVVPNEGWLVEDIAASKRQRVETTIVKHDLVDIRWANRIQWFLLGMVTAVLLITLLGAIVHPNKGVAERKLRDALTEYLNAGASPLGIGGAK